MHPQPRQHPHRRITTQPLRPFKPRTRPLIKPCQHRLLQSAPRLPRSHIHHPALPIKLLPAQRANVPQALTERTQTTPHRRPTIRHPLLNIRPGHQPDRLLRHQQRPLPGLRLRQPLPLEQAHLHRHLSRLLYPRAIRPHQLSQPERRLSIRINAKRNRILRHWTIIYANRNKSRSESRNFRAANCCY